jgi:hypothetical protein
MEGLLESLSRSLSVIFGHFLPGFQLAGEVRRAAQLAGAGSQRRQEGCFRHAAVVRRGPPGRNLLRRRLADGTVRYRLKQRDIGLHS